MCNCLNETLEIVKAKVKEEIEGKADLSTFNAEYDGRVLRFDGKSNNVMLKVNYEFFKLKSGGERYKKLTKSSVSLAMAYCPICGGKYE